MRFDLLRNDLTRIVCAMVPPELYEPESGEAFIDVQDIAAALATMPWTTGT